MKLLALYLPEPKLLVVLIYWDGGWERGISKSLGLLWLRPLRNSQVPF